MRSVNSGNMNLFNTISDLFSNAQFGITAELTAVSKVGDEKHIGFVVVGFFFGGGDEEGGCGVYNSMGFCV